jgi:hypothetical protein
MVTYGRRPRKSDDGEAERRWRGRHDGFLQVWFNLRATAGPEPKLELLQWRREMGAFSSHLNDS